MGREGGGEKVRKDETEKIETKEEQRMKEVKD